MSRRTEQIAETIRRAVQAVLTEGLADPRLAGLMLTVTTVGVDTDLTTAVVRVSVLPHDREDLALHALKSAARHIRHEVGDRIALHKMPEFMFKLDEGLKKQAEILRALSKVREEAASRPAPNDPDSENPETTA
ncbi:MAG: 30S ribosome-binding factor RbfA [Planctomycetes bacterium]|nr:30S ribosome-binding factor RbfA [Planctomycetota bacterium]